MVCLFSVDSQYCAATVCLKSYCAGSVVIIESRLDCCSGYYTPICDPATSLRYYPTEGVNVASSATRDPAGTDLLENQCVFLDCHFNQQHQHLYI